MEESVSLNHVIAFPYGSKWVCIDFYMVVPELISKFAERHPNNRCCTCLA